jgi:hypothetical protein
MNEYSKTKQCTLTVQLLACSTAHVHAANMHTHSLADYFLYAQNIFMHKMCVLTR